MGDRTRDLFGELIEGEAEPEATQCGLGFAVPFTKSRALVKLDLERAEADRREPKTLTLDGRDEFDESED